MERRWSYDGAPWLAALKMPTLGNKKSSADHCSGYNVPKSAQKSASLQPRNRKLSLHYNWNYYWLR